jgi:hypothetical protein
MGSCVALFFDSGRAGGRVLPLVCCLLHGFLLRDFYLVRWSACHQVTFSALSLYQGTVTMSYWFSFRRWPSLAPPYVPMRSLRPRGALVITCARLGWVSALTIRCSGVVHSYIKLLSPVLIVFLSQSQCRIAYMHCQRTYNQLANVQLVMCAFRLLRFG